jgi:hypothetical protein
VAWGWLDPEVGDDNDSITLRFQGGAKVLLKENMALAATLLLWWADEDLFFDEDEGVDDTNIEGSIGLRFYY